MMPRRIMLTADAVGGVWRYATELAAGFAARGADVLLVAMGPPPSCAQRAEVAAIERCTLRLTGLALDWLAANPDVIRAAAEELAQLAAEWRADTVQLHAPAYVSLAGWPAPVIAAAHSCVGTWWRAMRSAPIPPDLAWRAELVASGLVDADAVIAPSCSFAEALAAAYGVEREIRVRVERPHADPRPADTARAWPYRRAAVG